MVFMGKTVIPKFSTSTSFQEVAARGKDVIDWGRSVDHDIRETRAWVCPECLKAEAEWTAQWLRERS
jgi:hypothetical protein